MDIDSIAVTELLGRWRSGDHDAENELFAAVYPVLRGVCRKQLRGSGRALTLDVTDLAHESYLRLARLSRFEFQGREHFFAIAAKIVRCLVIDLVRRRITRHKLIQASAADLNQPRRLDLSVDWLSVDEALTQLEVHDERSAAVVELKCFSGLTAKEIASTLGVSVPTVERRWRFGKAWLADYLGPNSSKDTI